MDHAAPRTDNTDFAPMALLHAIGLTLVALNGFRAYVSGEFGWQISTVYLLFYVHVIFSIVRGAFDRRTAVTWVLMFIVFILAEGASFLDYILPWGQLSFKLASSPIGPYVDRFMANIAFMGLDLKTLGMVLFVGAIGLNVSARFALSPVGHSMLERMLALCAVLAVGILLLTGMFGSAAEQETLSALAVPAHIVPEWYVLPFYAALRAIHSKLGGLIVMFAVMAMPILAIFITKARNQAAKALLAVLLLLNLFSFVGLIFLGAQPPDNTVILASRVLLGVYVAYFAFGLLLTSKKAADP